MNTEQLLRRQVLGLELSPEERKRIALKNQEVINKLMNPNNGNQSFENNEDFYFELDELVFLHKNADELGLSDEEKIIINCEIDKRRKNADIVMIYDRELPDLKNCLPEVLKAKYRENKYKEVINNYYSDFKALSLSNKISFLEKEQTWSILEVGGDIIGYGLHDDTFSTDADYDDFETELNGNILYTSLKFLQEIIEKNIIQETGFLNKI